MKNQNKRLPNLPRSGSHQKNSISPIITQKPPNGKLCWLDNSQVAKLLEIEEVVAKRLGEVAA